MSATKRKSSQQDGEETFPRSKQGGKVAPRDQEKQRSDDVASSDEDTGTKLRRALGLTATMATDSNSNNLPDPYAVSYLDENSESKDDSLAKLAKLSFKRLSKAGTELWTPTPIQLQSWPILRSISEKLLPSNPKQPNLIAIATTGSGKTLSYALPMVDSCSLVEGKKSRRYVHGLVIVPTRELALQVFKVLKKVTKTANKLSGKTDKIVAQAIYGGVDREEQIDSLSKNHQYILAATPLRLIDLLGIGDKDGKGNQAIPNESIQRLFKSMRYLVIDEADQMATKSDMSQQVDLILNFLREKCPRLDRKCLFSATLPKRAIKKCNEWIDLPMVTVKVDTVTVGEAIAKDTAKDGSTTNNGSDSEGKSNKSIERKGALDLSTIPSHITQTLHVCSNHKKRKKLLATISKIRKEEKERGNRRRALLIIFFGRIQTLQDIHNMLKKEQIQGVALHSQMNQEKRESQLNLFRSGKCPLLLATDVAARGIHIKNVEYVINYDFPGSLEQYVHRCGRAGRSKVSGAARDDKKEQTSNATVYSFFHRELAPMASDMVDLLRSCNAWIDPNLVALVPGGKRKGYGESKRKRRKRDKTKIDTKDNVDADAPKAKKTKNSEDADDTGFMEEVEDEFPDLAPNRIVLKRASHVPLSNSESDDAS